MKYVIIGNSAAGIGCVEGIRQTDKDSEIIIISDEPYHTYSRPLISYLLCGKTNEQAMKYRGDSFYTENNVTLLAPERAASIDVSGKTVLLESGKTIPYDKLLIGTGSSPLIPPMNGLDTVTNKFTFMSLDDAKALERVLEADRRVLIIGAGLIGLKCAEGIMDRVKSIEAVDLAPRVLSSILDDTGAGIIQRHLEKKGLIFHLNQRVDMFDKNRAILKDGAHIQFDILILAVGVRPSVGLVKDAGGEIGRAIKINAQMETSLSDVYAAGDCTESLDVSSRENKVMALLPNAYMQGECAGVNMAGGSKAFDNAIPLNAIGFLGSHVLTAGTYAGEVHTEYSGKIYKKFFCADNRLSGFILIDCVEKAGIYTNLVRTRTPLDTLDTELLFRRPGLIAFMGVERKAMLGGVR
ncbi:MAG: FAD-dependent oxidoreductase [Clostridiales bacterium]|nr:FAD-dependent oxidoreductase [Clostridiales bacterium]